MIRYILLFSFIITPFPTFAKGRVAEQLCSQPHFHCIDVPKGQKWKDIWPDETQRHLIMRLNRMNTGIIPKMKIVVPDDLEHTTLLDVAPFQKDIPASGEKVIQVDLSLLAWAAYDANGKLVRWGPASGGKGFCPDIQQKCTTVTGTFKIQRKGGAKCKSHTYPVDNPGAPMPYCMFFKGGYAMHGSPNVPGYHASHGCVRIWVDDAKWLNQEFVEIGTPIIIK